MQGGTQHLKHVERASSRFAIMLHDSHKAVFDDGGVNLNSHRILGVASEGLHPEMQLYPTEEFMRSFS